MTPRSFGMIYGVDFSGARLAGENIWVAAARPAGGQKLGLVDLWNLEAKCGTAEREPALRYLVDTILKSKDALWAIDFPFGLPIEVMDGETRWPGQIELTNSWKGDARDMGLWCMKRSQASHGRRHLRRTTDSDVKTPFDCYHYRIVYQTFHGMRDVIGPLLGTRGTAIAPFQYRRIAKAARVVLEACPSSTLKRMSLPHQNYKQPTGGPLTAKRRATRRRILQGLSSQINIGVSHQRVVARNPGGDALDAVIAAVGAFQSWRDADHDSIARHPRYPLEGFIYA